ncbi:Eukaryotic translation initiation factor 5A-1 [Cichlidogyrus casuarinus]|uniref:Eukaryotic translation initiation factor 5 n=1 Tax=Cichlidogyrus casuarinus TaxID=1844966 RepID=A0ABD2Q488_9PLAT
MDGPQIKALNEGGHGSTEKAWDLDDESSIFFTMAININREVEDTFYRYKMPKLQAKVEGKGNGIKTVIVNITDIARALYRKPIYVTKYFGCVLGAQVNVDKQNERHIVNGAHDAAKLQQILDGFIKDFVLCPNCHNPETDISVKKNAQTVKATCKACGATKLLDPRHRLTQYIMKNPPEEGEFKRSSKTTSNTNKQNSDEDGEFAVNASMGDDRNDEEEDDDWGEDTSEDAQRRRMEELSSRVKSLAMSTDVVKSKSERAQLLFTLVSKFNESGDLLQHADAVCEEADRLDLSSHGVLVLTEVLLKDPNTVVKQMVTFASLYRRLIESSESPEKSQMNLLNGLVALVDQYPEMLKKVALLVKTMYDQDVCEEEVILKWADKGPSSKFGPRKLHQEILSKCKVFFDWLREAEEEEDSNDDGDEVEQEPVLPKQSNGADKPKAPQPTATKPSEEQDDDDDDDIDIDAI